MDKNPKSLLRGGMYFLIFAPVLGLITRFFTVWELLGALCLFAAVCAASFAALLPKYVGSYTETEVIRYEGGINRGDDPNPDRESRHETIKEGRRFALRLPAEIALMAISVFLLALIPQSAFAHEKSLYRVVFILIIAAGQAGCMASVASDYCIWTQLPGIAIGFISYIASALYLRMSKGEAGGFGALLAVCALIFLFGAFICLNRASLSAETGNAGGRAPKLLEKRNRRIVIVFAALVSIVSFVKPVRNAVIWALKQIGGLFAALFRLIGGGKGDGGGALDEILFKVEEGETLIEEAEEAAEEIEEISEGPLDRILVYAFIALLIFGVIYILYSLATRKLKRDGYLFGKPRRVQSDGYYDEKDRLDGDEIRKKYAGGILFGLKNAFKRETSWDRLSGREKARRLFKAARRKRLNDLSGAKSLTARETLSKMKLNDDSARKLAEVYETARYSDNDVDSKAVDELRRELKL